MEWKKYAKKPQTMRDVEPGETFEGVSINPEDRAEVDTWLADNSRPIGRIGRNDKNHRDMWYISTQFLKDFYLPDPV
jgi:hypothetical protein